MNKIFEKNLLKNWFEQMEHELDYYKEPILEEYTVGVIQLACNTFNQELQVFFMTVDVIEQYIYLKDLRGEKIYDPLFSVCVVFFIVSKYVGGTFEMKTPSIQKFMLTMTGREYTTKMIISLEREILHILDCRLPFTTVLDDFNTFFQHVRTDYRLNDTLHRLCINIFQLVYLLRKIWFEELKDLYSDDPTAFRYLMCSKFFLPIGILVSAFRLTNYQFILDIDYFLQKLRIVTKIHPDHIYAFSTIILNCISTHQRYRKFIKSQSNYAIQ
ncbi:uncharacterized protein LOC115874328 [Sitophilus oryzae]|uniref:Uncharacterized protein LOC115874328 n=1 Tax=Sitophilus oryzae TaxID=7048 RepID=A0A6J2X250_SITOR|nr:uncharacterized protein LOC115874328 [Sitophilus oryzae]